MNIHDKHINESIDKNIIGTCNIVKICKKYNVKLIYFSTSYVYQVLKVIIKKQTLYCLLIITHGLN